MPITSALSATFEVIDVHLRNLPTTIIYGLNGLRQTEESQKQGIL